MSETVTLYLYKSIGSWQRRFRLLPVTITWKFDQKLDVCTVTQAGHCTEELHEIA